jgi:hypothetical protein
MQTPYRYLDITALSRNTHNTGPDCWGKLKKSLLSTEPEIIMPLLWLLTLMPILRRIGWAVIQPRTSTNDSRPRWSSDSVLATGPKVRGFKPGWGRWIFKGDKIHSTTSFGGEVKPSVSCRRFTACKRTLRAWNRCFIGKIQRPCFSPMPLLLRY